jgi:threonine dehydrogenase-like Zn-dependent dehydrogenase
MANEPYDWTGWAIGALGTMALAIVGMGRIIMGISTTRIAQLEKQLADYVIFADNRAQKMIELRLAALEGNLRTNKKGIDDE